MAMPIHGSKYLIRLRLSGSSGMAWPFREEGWICWENVASIGFRIKLATRRWRFRLEHALQPSTSVIQCSQFPLKISRILVTYKPLSMGIFVHILDNVGQTGISQWQDEFGIRGWNHGRLEPN